MILVDTSGLLAALDAAQRLHREAAASLAAASPPLLLSPFVLAELNLLLATRVGLAARILASRHKIQDVLTLDQRHLRALAANDRPFRLLPGDN